jgi:hypothetical protein
VGNNDKITCSVIFIDKHNSTVKPLLTDLYGENHRSDKPISRMSEGKGNMVIDVKK